MTTPDLLPRDLPPLPVVPGGRRRPRFAHQIDPRTAGPEIDHDLLRVSWCAQPAGSALPFGPPRVVEFLPDLTGVSARILGIRGDAFPGGTPAIADEYAAELLAAVRPGIDETPPLGPTLWHYAVTAPTIRRVFERCRAPADRLAALIVPAEAQSFCGAGVRLRDEVPQIRQVFARRAHQPFVHDPFALDAIVTVSEQRCDDFARLLGAEIGRDWLHRQGSAPDMLPVLAGLHPTDRLALLAAIDTARAFDLGRHDFVILLLGRVESAAPRALADRDEAARLFARSVAEADTQVQEMRHRDRRQLLDSLRGLIADPLWQAMRHRQFSQILNAWEAALDRAG